MKSAIILLLLTFLAKIETVIAQEKPSYYSTRATTFGIGRTNMLDTYLSPRNYTGEELTFMHQTMSLTKHPSSRISRQMLWQINFSSTQNSAKNGGEYSGLANWNIAWYYHWDFSPNLRLMVGGQYSLNAGTLYNTRNSNNPTQTKAYTHIAASGIARYNFKIHNYLITAHYQIDMPMIGAAFTPNYGQSYYEIFRYKYYDNNIRITYPGNAPSWRQQANLDLPINNTAIRIGYLMDIRQSALNNLKTHSYSHAFMIGYVRYIARYGAKKKKVHTSFIN